MKKSDIAGWKKIFSFTFIQNYKSKAAIVSLIVTCILIIVSGPVVTLLIGSGAAEKLSDLSDCKIENVYVKNDTAYTFDADEFKKQEPYYEKINFTDTDKAPDEFKEVFKDDALRDIMLHIYEDNERYHMVFYHAEGSELSTMNIGMFSDEIEDFFRDSKMSQTGISSEISDFINSEINTAVVEASDISAEDDKEEMNEVVMTAVIIYACVIMMIVLVSSQQIAASIVLEKSSKVIETLLMSARPLAIIVGKILGTMAVLICNCVLMLISGLVSSVLSAVVASKSMEEAANIALEALNKASAGGTPDIAAPVSSDISLGRIVFGIFAVIVTTILAYLFYSVISGMTGASCSSIEDLSSSSSFISMMTVIGVYMVMGCSFINNQIFTTVTYFFPFSGIYIVPIHYIFGKASLSDLLILWGEVILLTALLFRFAAKIYHVLIYHKGERLKLKHILSISKSQKGQG
ncbi:MAG: hypothetical protein E7505_01010 [Ruminococcus sp.]|nr:hypothetical protein [Ruminococcus sp.]